MNNFEETVAVPCTFSMMISFCLWSIPFCGYLGGGYFCCHRAPAPPTVTTRLKRETIATSWHPHGTSLQACHSNTSPKTTNDERTNDTKRLFAPPETLRYVSPLPSSASSAEQGKKKTTGNIGGKNNSPVESELANETSTYSHQQPNNHHKPQSWVKYTDLSLVPVKSSLRPRRYAAALSPPE